MAENGKLSLHRKLIKLGESLKLNAGKKNKDGTPHNFRDLLLPSMNKIGVTLDIIKEEGTAHDGQGSAYCYQLSRNRQTVYGAYLTIRWTNADDRGDTLEATIHANASHEDPYTAKAKAWAKCLTDYFWFKFGVFVVFDIPDMGGPAAKPQEKPENKPTVSQTAQGGINTHPRTGNNGSGQGKGIVGLSNAQLQRMYRKATAAGLTQGQVDQEIYHRYQLKDPREMTREQYESICSNLDYVARERGDNHA